MTLPPNEWSSRDLRDFISKFERKTALEDPTGWAEHALTEPLPDGWKSAHDPVEDAFYYYNESTLATTWTAPTTPIWRRLELYLQMKLACKQRNR